jgi:hypothetical protein
MKNKTTLTIALIAVGVCMVCAALGWTAGRFGARQMADLSGIIVNGTDISTPTIRSGRRIRIYMGSEIQGSPTFTLVAGRVYRGDQVENQPMLTLEGNLVYSGNGTDGPLLYRFDGNQVMEAHGNGPALLVQRNSNIHFGPDPQAPVLFAFEGTHIYRGDVSHGRVLATSNTVLDDPDMVKLIAIVLRDETLE